MSAKNNSIFPGNTPEGDILTRKIESSLGTGAVIHECRNDVVKQRIQQGSNIAFSAESYKFLSLRRDFAMIANLAAVSIKTSQTGGTDGTVR